MFLKYKTQIAPKIATRYLHYNYILRKKIIFQIQNPTAYFQNKIQIELKIAT